MRWVSGEREIVQNQNSYSVARDSGTHNMLQRGVQTSGHAPKEELKHDLNELCIYVHKLFGYCEGAWRATDLVVLTLWTILATSLRLFLDRWRVDRG